MRFYCGTLSSVIKADEGCALNTPQVTVTKPFAGAMMNRRGELTSCHLPDAFLITEEDEWKEEKREE